MAVMLLAACEPAPTITIEPGTVPGRITFAFARGNTSSPAMIAAFRVDACAARGSPTPESQWLTLAEDDAEPITRIVYGIPPAGWRSVQGPQPMSAGCYRAAVAGAPPLEFDVLADGTVKARR